MNTRHAHTTPWNQRLVADKHPKRVRLDKDFAGIKAGQTMLVGTPLMIDSYVRRIPFGETRTVERMRRELARKHQCDAACPVSTGIFLRICAEASLEQLAAGEPRDSVAPFWRLVEPSSPLAHKLPIGKDWIAIQRAQEQA